MAIRDSDPHREAVKAEIGKVGVVHIYAPQPVMKFVSSGQCPDCKRRTRFIGVYYEWHGPTSTCLRCGRRWEDSEWMPLDFERGARQKSIDRAKRAFRMATCADAIERGEYK